MRQYGNQYVSSKRAAIVQDLAAEIMKSGVKAKDALHIACALDAGCAYLLTTDDRMLKYKNKDLLILNPVVFILMEAGK